MSALEAITEDFRGSVLERSERVPWPVLGLLATGSAVLKTSLGELLVLEKLDRSPNPFAPLAISLRRRNDLRRLHHVLLAHLVIQFFEGIDDGENRDRFAEMIDCAPNEALEEVLTALGEFEDEIGRELSAELLEVWDAGDRDRYADVTYKSALVAGGIRVPRRPPVADVRFVTDALRLAANTLDEEFWEAMNALRDE